MSRAWLAVRLLGRDWRGGELGLMLSGLVLSVAIVVAISGFVERIQAAIELESAEFIAADRIVRGSYAPPEPWFAITQAHALASALVLNFPTMAFTNDNMQLVAVKAVTDSYPLLGELAIQQSTDVTSEWLTRRTGPPAGEVWVGPRLVQLLQLQIGSLLNIGDAQLRVSAVVQREPDAGLSSFMYGPRVLMNFSDIARTQVVQPGSRVEYNFLVQGESSALLAWEQEIEPWLRDGEQVVGVREGQPQLARSINRAERFLLLAGAMGVILAGVAIAIASRRYTERHYDHVGILRSFGCKRGEILVMYLGHLLLLALLAVALGSLLGFLVQAIALSSLRSLISADLPAAGWAPYGLGLMTALISVLAFAAPALLHLQTITPMRVLRRDSGKTDYRSRAVLVCGVLGLAGVVYLYTASLGVTLALTAGVLLVSLLSTWLTWMLLRHAPRLSSSAHPLALALAGIRRRAVQCALQVFVFTIVLMLVLALLIMRNSLIEDWRLQLPENTPDHFLVNLNQNNLPGLQTFLTQKDINHAGIFPMVRGRLLSSSTQAETDIKTADAAVVNSEATEEQAADQPPREINLSWAAELPADNEITSGQWFQGESSGLVSLEAEYAERLGVKVGDHLRYVVGSEEVTLEISSLRSLRWDSMRPNFFVLASPGSLDHLPATYMTSFYLPAQRKPLLNTLLAEFPEVSIIEIDRIIAQVGRIIDQVSMAVELVLGLIIIAALIVLVASVQSSMDERNREVATMKTLGAGGPMLRRAMLFEFALLGILAGVLAAAGAELLMFILQTQVMQISFSPHAFAYVLGPICGALAVTAIGAWVSTRSLRTPPMVVLRQL